MSGNLAVAAASPPAANGFRVISPFSAYSCAAYIDKTPNPEAI